MGDFVFLSTDFGLDSESQAIYKFPCRHCTKNYEAVSVKWLINLKGWLIPEGKTHFNRKVLMSHWDFISALPRKDAKIKCK